MVRVCNIAGKRIQEKEKRDARSTKQCEVMWEGLYRVEGSKL